MFIEKQNQVLAYELDNSRVRTRDKGNVTLSYLEGHDIIETANRIFGYGNWNYTISKLEQVSQELNQNQNHCICYKAVIQITVHNLDHSKETIREDVGFGTGIAKTLSDAHESGAKEAVTDAIKRAMRSFGNQFGNSLYGKSQHNQPVQQQIPHNPQSQNYQRQQPMQQQSQPPQNQRNNHTPQDYASLYNLGLTIAEQGNNLIVLGDDIFSKKDSIKACGFMWDSAKKMWNKQIQQPQAA